MNGEKDNNGNSSIIAIGGVFLRWTEEEKKRKKSKKVSLEIHL
jgi:hypothetical protein